MGQKWDKPQMQGLKTWLFLDWDWAGSSLVHRFDHVFHHLFGIAKDHHGFVHVEQLVV
jgi:hypothetical protein